METFILHIENPSTYSLMSFLVLTGRGERTWTSDPLNPIQVRFQTALRPDFYIILNDFIYSNKVLLFFIELLYWFTRGRRMQGKIDSHFHGNDREESENDSKEKRDCFVITLLAMTKIRSGNHIRARRVRWIEPLQMIKEEDVGEIIVWWIFFLRSLLLDLLVRGLAAFRWLYRREVYWL